MVQGSHIKQFLTSLSINSKAGVEFEIRKQERVHWLLGLRQAELFIQEKTEALATNYRLQREQARTCRGWRREFDDLQALPSPTPDQLDQIEKLEDDIAAVQRSSQTLEPLIRDCVMELAVAKAEKERILTAHPEAIALSYTELQERYGHVALMEKQAQFAAAEIWASQNNLPVSVGHLLFDLSPSEREYCLTREMELRNGLRVSEAIAHAAQVLASLPPEHQKQALLQAAQTVMHSSSLPVATHE